MHERNMTAIMGEALGLAGQKKGLDAGLSLPSSREDS
jgi:hypothetical protein